MTLLFHWLTLLFFAFQIHISVVLVLGAWAALAAVRGLDLNVYHKMLRGSVTFGEDFEEKYMKQIFDLNKGMTQAISHFSRYKIVEIKASSDGRYEYEGKCKVTAEDKIRQFYDNATRFLWAAALALFLVTNIPIWMDYYSSQDVAGEPSVESSSEVPSDKLVGNATDE